MELIPLITNFLIYLLAALLLVLIISYIYRRITSQSSVDEEKIREHREVVRKYIQTQSQYLANSQNYESAELNKVRYTAPQFTLSENRTRNRATATKTRSTSQKTLTGSKSNRYSILNSSKTESTEFFFPLSHSFQSDRKNHYFR